MEKINNNENALRKQILELGPLALFFIGNYFLGILWGTGILVFATLISISASWFIEKKIPLMLTSQLSLDLLSSSFVLKQAFKRTISRMRELTTIKNIYL